MRRIIFMIMIALLPLRGWAGEAMATQMAIQNTIAHAHTTVNFTVVQATVAAMSPECALRMTMTTDDKGAADSTCLDCQACHMIVLTEAVKARNNSAAKLAFEVSASIYFASAEPQFSLKPPIFSA